MNATYNVTGKTGYTNILNSSFGGTGTFQDNRFRLEKAAAVAEATSIIQEAHMAYLRTLAIPEVGDDYSDEEELEWSAFFARSDVQAELEQLAEEAEREFAAGETEEGGFA